MEGSDWSGREDSSRVGGYVREGRDWHVREEQRAPTASRTVPSVVGGSVHGKMHDLRCNTVVGAVGFLHADIGSFPPGRFSVYFSLQYLGLEAFVERAVVGVVSVYLYLATLHSPPRSGLLFCYCYVISVSFL